ncbi:large ribosomal subunit protein mL42 [Scleropages formosus]|uniref:Large ribosomal subunit protein mL42 n=1 Tax=Scleropages formosus TaxID=113540 RepID=A0A8C9V0Z2_SCLFO|nr:39S ribosomal protein L42, mitochondrial [Scleropages formosus]
MAAGQTTRLTGVFLRLLNFARQRHSASGSFVCVRQQSTDHGLPSDSPSCKVEIGLTSDGKTVVCYHPSVDFPYDLSQPIPRPDPLTNPAETHDQVLKAHLSKEVLQNREGPTIEELSKMFFTTKHRWYPYGQYHRRRKKMNPPKDR